MQLIMQGESSRGGSSELANNSSDDSQMVVALRKMKKELEVMVVHTVRQEIRTVVEDLVKVEIQSAVKKLLPDRNRNYADEIDTSREGVLQLQFMDEVSLTVLTGKEIESKEGTPIRVTLLGETTGYDVHDRPEASAKVEILVLEASADDNGCDWSLEEFNNRIIKDKDKKKPHFTKSQYVYLKDGTGVLSDLKLGHDKNWTKICHCRLGARIVGNYPGVKVKEALSGPFIVRDNRGNLYKKRYPPILSDELWKLKNIGKDGRPVKSLNKDKIFTVRDFLFLHHIDAQKLEDTAGVHGQKWNATVNHAQTCVIDDKKIYLYCPSSGEPKKGVVFDVVGRLKGIIRDSCYVPVTNLSADEKAGQHNLLKSAFETREDLPYFEDETSLLHQFPFPSSEIADNDDSTLGADSLFSGLDLDSENFGLGHIFGGSNSLSDSLSLQNNYENFGLDLSFGESSLPDSGWPEAHSCQQSLAGRNYGVIAFYFIHWVSRAKIRVRGQGDRFASKKQKIVCV